MPQTDNVVNHRTLSCVQCNIVMALTYHNIVKCHVTPFRPITFSRPSIKVQLLKFNVELCAPLFLRLNARYQRLELQMKRKEIGGIIVGSACSTFVRFAAAAAAASDNDKLTATMMMIGLVMMMMMMMMMIERLGKGRT